MAAAVEKTMFKYVNRNSFPVILPGKGGENVMFNASPPSSDSSTDPWFSAFVGRNLLSRERADAPPPVPPPNPGKELNERLITVLTETTEHWVKKSGVYSCTHCQMFRTGSRRDMLGHLKGYHMIDAEPVQESQTPVLNVPAIPVVENAPKPHESPLVEDPPSPVIPEPVIATNPPVEPVYQCDVCGRNFKSEHGMKIHRGRKHGLGPDEALGTPTE